MRPWGPDQENRPVQKSLQDPLAIASESDPGPISREEEEENMEQSTQETSNDVGSSFADSDEEGDTLNTQQTAATELSQPARSTGLSHAETLRLRLRLALFKVQTNQTNIPLSQLRIPSREPNPLPEQSSPTLPTTLPTLLPAPILKPTAYSTRKIDEQPQMPSSPPSSIVGSPTKEDPPEVFRTPALPRRKPSLSEQSSSPPSHDGDHHKRNMEYRHLSSSAVKGDAAVSLLGLREDRR
ncbi:MAG: hypothetical protein Q9218_005658 [Villophora microphyllina]